MSAVHIHTAPNGLLAIEASASAKLLSAYFYSCTKAQMVARAANPDPTTTAYFTAFIQSLTTLGWSATRTEPIVHSPGPAAVTPLQACADAALAAATQGALTSLPLPTTGIEGVVSALTAALGDVPAEVAAQLDAWWSAGSLSVADRSFALGPIVEIFGIPFISAVHLNIALSASSWRSLIEPAADFTFAVTPVLMTLRWAAYDAISKALEDELSATLSDHIRTATLDLETGRLAAVE